jgi:hypothetical protein
MYSPTKIGSQIVHVLRKADISLPPMYHECATAHQAFLHTTVFSSAQVTHPPGHIPLFQGFQFLSYTQPYLGHGE